MQTDKNSAQLIMVIVGIFVVLFLFGDRIKGGSNGTSPAPAAAPASGGVAGAPFSQPITNAPVSAGVAPQAAPIQPPAPRLSAASGGTFTQSCTGGAVLEEAPDGNIWMPSGNPAGSFDCDFVPASGGQRYWKGVNATLTSGGAMIAKGGNNVPVTITAGQSYHVHGGPGNGGFALQTYTS